jgi:Fe-S cluster assembly protein SufD
MITHNIPAARILHDSEASEIAALFSAVFESAGVPLPEVREAVIVETAEHLSISPERDVLIIVKANAEAVITEESATGSYVVLEENAKLRYLTISNGKNRRIVCLKQDSQLIWNDATFGAESDNLIYLAERGANARFGSLMLGREQQRCVQHATMVHASPKTSSYMLTRSVLTEHSTGVYRGTIRILPGARGCDAMQKADTLLLGDNSRMDAIPVLEISNDDVRCSHGVAIGQVDEEQLFYLQSRGIPRDDAIRMIVRGFFDQMLIAMGEAGERLRQRLEGAI